MRPGTRRWLRVLLTLSAILAGWFLYALLRPLPALERHRQLRIGMTEDEVTRHFGASPDSTFFERYETSPGASRAMKYWACDAGVVTVSFDKDGRLKDWSYSSYKSMPSLWDRILWRLGLYTPPPVPPPMLT
jgi:hypothetical protein